MYQLFVVIGDRKGYWEVVSIVTVITIKKNENNNSHKDFIF